MIVKGFPEYRSRNQAASWRSFWNGWERVKMEIVNDYAPAEIEEIFAQSLVPGMSPLPLTAMRKCDPLAQFVVAFWTYRNRAWSRGPALPATACSCASELGRRTPCTL